MKYSSILMAFLFALQTGAVAQARPSSQVEAGIPGCVDGSCKKDKTPSNKDEILRLMRNLGLAKEVEAEPKAPAAVQVTPPAPPPETSTKISAVEDANDLIDSSPIKNAPLCSKFIDNDELQSKGKVVSKLFDDGHYDNLEKGPRDLVQLCPRYPTMKMEDKKALWTLFATMWTFFESTCDPNKRNHGAPNGTAVGILQLDYGKEQIFPGCKKGDALDPAKSLKCSFAILNRQADPERNGVIFSGVNNHWSTLKPQNRERPANIGTSAANFMMSKICRFKACGAELSECQKNANKIYGQAVVDSKQASPKRTKKVANR